MKFRKGNKAAANPSRKAVAELIRKRLEKEGESLPITLVASLAATYARLTAKRHRKVKPKAKTSKADPKAEPFDYRAELAPAQYGALLQKLERGEATPDERTAALIYARKRARRQRTRADQTPKTPTDAETPVVSTLAEDLAAMRAAVPQPQY